MKGSFATSPFLGVLILFGSSFIASARNIEWNDLKIANGHHQEVGRESCVEDYSPCTCINSPSYGLEIICDSVDAQTIQQVFSRTTSNDLFSFQLTVPPPSEGNVVAIPADLLSGKRAGNILVTCPVPQWQLTIDADAFRPSSDFAFFFFSAGCDQSQLDFSSFLNSFLKLSTIFISQSSNVQNIQNLPALPSLTQLAITYSTGLDQIADFSRLGRTQLKRLWLNGNQLGDQIVGDMLNAIASSPSAASALEMLWLTTNQLTQIPAQMDSFSQLMQLDLSNNSLPALIASGSFVFNAPVDYLYLESDGISSIEPDAFQGDFSRGQIYLRSNSLTRFEEAVFKSLLEQMVVTNGGGLVNLESNPVNCGDCHLAWLIRDNPNLLSAVKSATCSDGTPFASLSPSIFSSCP
ncbi:uncharacterized protein LOC124341131 [Daphnia pulicaria]|uniref:uncharacterized protein LOC124341131 n=1 Tax=Daphnia pulicaria TaxID=35523 RepID=UPI001EEB4413|nr:uncharacterized protein LOC124341131 [Daphnia pulicaria]